MENFKFILLSVIVILVLGLIGYWAVITIESGNISVEKQKQKELEDGNRQLEEKVAELKSELALLQSKKEEPAPNNITPNEPIVKTPTPTPTILKYQSLINDLQKLVDNMIFMKEKSIGARVGTIQTFLNIYNNISKKIDNDYGAGTKTDVSAFQKAEGLTADGEAGPDTFQKMIDWLKKQ